MVFAAIRIFSRSVARFFSSESAAPISLRCSSRWNRPSPAPAGSPGTRPRSADRIACAIGRRSLFDTDRAHLRDVGDALKDFLDAVHLQGAHAFLERDREHLGDPGMLLDELLDRIGADEQLVQADAPLVAGVAARVAAHLL